MSSAVRSYFLSVHPMKFVLCGRVRSWSLVTTTTFQRLVGVKVDARDGSVVVRCRVHPKHLFDLVNCSSLCRNQLFSSPFICSSVLTIHISSFNVQCIAVHI
jgi:hypothetical protein